MSGSSFSYTSPDEMLRHAGQMGIELPWREDTSILGSPVAVGGKELSNRLMVQPVEGFDADQNGSPSRRTIGRYCELAEGGFGSIWMESIAVNREGRSNPGQLWLQRENAAEFAAMLHEIRRAAGRPVYIVAQLTHSGRYSSPSGTPEPVSAFSNPLIPKEGERIISDEGIRALEDDYVHSAELAAEAGFDAVDIRACHGYLINELFSAYQRQGEYGGCYENRVRMLLNIVERSLQVPGIDTAVRLNMCDGLAYPYGWGVKPQAEFEEDWSEPLCLIGTLYAKGVRLLNISCGIGAYSPYYIRPYDSGGPEPTEHPLQGVDRMLRAARAAKECAPDATVVASAFTWLREYAPGVAAGDIGGGGFDVAGFGRQPLAWPSFANAVLSGDAIRREGCCITCCGCTNIMKKEGKMMRCVMRERLRPFQQ